MPRNTSPTKPTVTAARPESTHHDPFDRLLLAQAITDGLTLVTSDRALLALGRDDVVAEVAGIA